MSKYLYNGVELPALPEWDKTTYPYAILYLTSGGLYMFSVCNKPFSYGTIEGFSFVGVWAEYNNAYKIYRVSEDLTQFELLNENENNGGYYSPCKTSEGDTLIWANTDILNEDGTVYLAASEPLPVVTGKWLFNETIKVIDTIDKMFNGSEISSFVSNHTEFNSIRVRTFFENMTQHNYLQYYTQGVEEYTKVYDYKSKTWLDEAYRTIDYGDKRFGATVEFYAWLTENAVPVGGEPEHPEEPETVLAWKKHDAYKPNSKSIAYLYNGVELPDINTVWTDKATYPCAIITRGIPNGTYYLTVCGDKPYYTEQAHSTDGYEPIVVAPKPFNGFGYVVGSWVLYIEDTGYGAALRTGTFELIWTNVDVMNKDNGSVYFNGSDPVIKGWDGNTFYRVMGGKWVKQDGVVPTE